MSQTAVTPGTTAGTAPDATTAPEAGALDAAEAAAVIAAARGRIDALDAQLLDLIEQRRAVSAEVQAARIGSGGPRLSLTREMEILECYRARLGRPGTDIAMLLLELCRGRA